MDPDERLPARPKVGARLGHRVTIRKLERTDAAGRKVRTHPRYNWRCTFIENGRRASKYFRTRAKAEEWAESREAESLAVGTDAIITALERSTVVETRASLEGLGLTLREAVNFAIAHHRLARDSWTVAELADAAVASRVKAGLSSRHTQDLRSKLKRFAKVFGGRSVSTITHREIESWLHGLKLAPASFNSFRRILVVAFNDAKREGQLEANPAEMVRPAKVVESEVGIITPVEAAAMLAGADGEIRPAIALGLFAGLRMSEIEQLDWSEIHLEFGNVQVKASKAKSARNRLVPIPDNLAAWLRSSPRRSGSVWPESHQRGRKMMEAARRAADYGSAAEVRKADGAVDKAGVKRAKGKGGKQKADQKPVAGATNIRKWPDNALRHSFATYHLAHHENAESLALHLGHSNTALIFAHYRKPVTKEEAAIFWAITPENAKELGKVDSGRSESK